MIVNPGPFWEKSIKKVYAVSFSHYSIALWIWSSVPSRCWSQKAVPAGVSWSCWGIEAALWWSWQSPCRPWSTQRLSDVSAIQVSSGLCFHCSSGFYTGNTQVTNFLQQLKTSLVVGIQMITKVIGSSDSEVKSKPSLHAVLLQTWTWLHGCAGSCHSICWLGFGVSLCLWEMLMDLRWTDT